MEPHHYIDLNGITSLVVYCAMNSTTVRAKPLAQTLSESTISTKFLESV